LIRVELYEAIRRDARREELSIRTVRAALSSEVPAPRKVPVRVAPKLEAAKPLIDAIASNETFSGRTKTFTDPRLCAAIVDRLTFGGNIIETGTTSYRLAHAGAQRAGQAAER
jgi:hypothetical protein